MTAKNHLLADRGRGMADVVLGSHISHTHRMPKKNVFGFVLRFFGSNCLE